MNCWEIFFLKKKRLFCEMFGEELASGSRHADNIAPCLFGGITLVKSSEPNGYYSAFFTRFVRLAVHPQVEVKTSDARQILKKISK
jgi:homoserine kinase